MLSSQIQGSNDMKALLMGTKGAGGKSPQCKVCGDESSGFHYGVDSCEGCKGFFRRCITQGMTHKCANEERCEITPFTRNSCQYCRLKKCFEVGMSREASRLGRRPKRLKDVSGENSRSHINQPIAPYPSPQEHYKIRMAELQKLLQANGTFKSELMQAFLSAAQQSFREHSKTGNHSSSSNINTGTTGSAVIINTANTSTLSPDVNLNVTPSPSTTALILGSQQVSYSSQGSTTPTTVDVNVTGGANPVHSPVSSSSVPPSPFPDLGLAELSPLESGVNLNMGHLYDKVFMNQGGNLNGNSSVYSPSGQSTDNMPSPLNLPALDNMDPTSPSNFLAYANVNQLASPGEPPLSSPTVNSSTGGTNLNQIANLNQQHQQQQQQQQQHQHQQQQQQQQSSSADSPTNLNMLSPGSIKQETDVSQFTTIKQEPQESATDDPNANQDHDVARILAEVRETPSDTRRLLIDQVTDAIVEGHMGSTINTYANVAEANERIRKNQSMPTDMPDMSKLSLSASKMWEHFLSSMVPEITKVVKFCKKLPGFCEVDQEDQVRLIKLGSFEVMVARFSILIDEVNETMLDPSHKMKSPRSVIQNMPLGTFLDEFFEVARRFNPLRLTDGEIALFTAILMICPSREGLKNVTAIRTIQQLYLQALYFLMKHNHKDYEKTFCSLVGMIPFFRKINDDHHKFLNNIKMKSPGEFEKFPPLHKEVFDGSASSS